MTTDRLRRGWYRGRCDWDDRCCFGSNELLEILVFSLTLEHALLRTPNDVEHAFFNELLSSATTKFSLVKSAAEERLLLDDSTSALLGKISETAFLQKEMEKFQYANYAYRKWSVRQTELTMLLAALSRPTRKAGRNLTLRPVKRKKVEMRKTYVRWKAACEIHITFCSRAKKIIFLQNRNVISLD